MARDVLAVLLVLCVLTLAGCEREPAPARPAAQKAQIEDGRKLAEANCAACHAVGDDGQSPHPRAPLFRTVLDRYNAATLATELIVGVRVAHAPMPAFEFDPAKADALVAYLQALQDGDVGAGSGASGGGSAMPRTEKTPARHTRYIEKGVPESYRGMLNLFKPTIGNLIEGARLYDLHCASCHGMMGVGDGEAGEKLKTPPADLSASLGQARYRDDFFYWTIADGGKEFQTAMPPFKAALTKGETWKIVTFMRAAFAESEAAATARDAVAPP